MLSAVLSLRTTRTREFYDLGDRERRILPRGDQHTLKKLAQYVAVAEIEGSISEIVAITCCTITTRCCCGRRSMLLNGSMKKLHRCWCTHSAVSRFSLLCALTIINQQHFERKLLCVTLYLFIFSVFVFFCHVFFAALAGQHRIAINVSYACHSSVIIDVESFGRDNLAPAEREEIKTFLLIYHFTLIPDIMLLR